MASHASVSVGSRTEEILRELQYPSQDSARHKNWEKNLNHDAEISNPNDAVLTYEYHKNYISYWGISKSQVPDNSQIIMPLNLSDKDASVSYEECLHHVVAIHSDTLPPRFNMEGALEYFSRCVDECLKKICSTDFAVPKDKVAFIIFKDLSDLPQLIQEEYERKGKEEEDGKFFELRHAVNPPSTIKLKSLHLLITKDTIENKSFDDFDISSYFLCVMKEGDQILPFGDYSSRIEGHHSSLQGNEEMRLTDFINLVTSFLFLKYSNITPVEDKDTSYRETIRIGMILKFFKQVRHGENAFGYTTIGESENCITGLPHGFRSWTKTYFPSTITNHGGFYKWLNQYNLRLFGEPLYQGVNPDPNWSPRDFFETQKASLIKIFESLPQYFGGGFKINCELLKEYRDGPSLVEILEEMERNDRKPDAAQLEFFSHIIEEFFDIWTGLSAKWTHHMLKQEYPYWRANFHIDILDLELVCFYVEVGNLCEKIARYKPKTSSLSNWVGYIEWGIDKNKR